jgi:Tfp pilus assembly protein PilX
MLSKRTHKLLNKQTGSTLIVTLIILILIMLLGATAMNTTDTQAKLTGNLQFQNVALNNAETMANTAEQSLANSAVASTFPVTITALPVAYDPLADTAANTAWQAVGYEIRYVSTNASPYAGLGLDCTDPANTHNYDCVNTFLVTAIGTGPRGATKIVQTYYTVALK